MEICIKKSFCIFLFYNYWGNVEKKMQRKFLGKFEGQSMFQKDSLL